MNPKVDVAIKLCLLLEPNRFKIAKLLANSESLYITQIADKLGLTRTLVGFHLTTLAEKGLVEGEFKVIEDPTPTKMGKAGKFYTLTDEAKYLVKSLLDFIEKVSVKLS